MVQRHGLRTILHVAVPVLVALGLVTPTAFLVKNVVWAVFAVAVALGSLVGLRDSAKGWSISAACSGGLSSSRWSGRGCSSRLVYGKGSDPSRSSRGSTDSIRSRMTAQA